MRLPPSLACRPLLLVILKIIKNYTFSSAGRSFKWWSLAFKGVRFHFSWASIIRTRQCVARRGVLGDKPSSIAEKPGYAAGTRAFLLALRHCTGARWGKKIGLALVAGAGASAFRFSWRAPGKLLSDKALIRISTLEIRMESARKSGWRTFNTFGHILKLRPSERKSKIYFYHKSDSRTISPQAISSTRLHFYHHGRWLQKLDFDYRTESQMHRKYRASRFYISPWCLNFLICLSSSDHVLLESAQVCN